MHALTFFLAPTSSWVVGHLGGGGGGGDGDGGGVQQQQFDVLRRGMPADAVVKVPSPRPI